MVGLPSKWPISFEKCLNDKLLSQWNVMMMCESACTSLLSSHLFNFPTFFFFQVKPQHKSEWVNQIQQFSFGQSIGNYWIKHKRKYRLGESLNVPGKNRPTIESNEASQKKKIELYDVEIRGNWTVIVISFKGDVCNRNVRNVSVSFSDAFSNDNGHLLNSNGVQIHWHHWHSKRSKNVETIHHKKNWFEFEGAKEFWLKFPTKYIFNVVGGFSV